MNDRKNPNDQHIDFIFDESELKPDPKVMEKIPSEPDKPVVVKEKSNDLDTKNATDKAVVDEKPLKKTPTALPAGNVQGFDDEIWLKDYESSDLLNIGNIGIDRKLNNEIVTLLSNYRVRFRQSKKMTMRSFTIAACRTFTAELSKGTISVSEKPESMPQLPDHDIGKSMPCYVPSELYLTFTQTRLDNEHLNDMASIVRASLAWYIPLAKARFKLKTK